MNTDNSFVKKYRLLNEVKTIPEWCAIFPFMWNRDFADDGYGFEEILAPPPVKDDTRIVGFAFSNYNDSGVWYTFGVDKGIHPNKYNKIEKAILSVLNEDTVVRNVDLERLRNGVSIIANWELPPSGKFWDEEKTRPISYETEYGSNGVRDYMKRIAANILQLLPLPEKTDTVVPDETYNEVILKVFDKGIGKEYILPDGTTLCEWSSYERLFEQNQELMEKLEILHEAKDTVGEDMVGLLRDCVSSTWGNKSLTETQLLFDKFLHDRKLAKPTQQLLNSFITDAVNRNIYDKKYSQSEVDAMMENVEEKAFWAAKCGVVIKKWTDDKQFSCNDVTPVTTIMEYRNHPDYKKYLELPHPHLPENQPPPPTAADTGKE